MNSITITDIDQSHDEPRIRDMRLAEALGFDRASNVRNLIKRNLAEIEAHGPLLQIEAMVSIGSGAKRPVPECWLNEPQALLICMFSRTPASAQVRRELIRVFMAYRRGETIDAAPKLALGADPAMVDIFSAGILETVSARARELADASIPRLQQELIRQFVLRLAGGDRIDITKEHFRTSILRRYIPGSTEDSRYMPSQWAWEIVPDVNNVQARRAIEDTIRKVIQPAKLIA